jgi:hypothetical protein
VNSAAGKRFGPNSLKKKKTPIPLPVTTTKKQLKKVMMMTLEASPLLLHYYNDLSLSLY